MRTPGTLQASTGDQKRPDGTLIYVYGYSVELRQSALRHGITEETARHVIAYAVTVLIVNSPYGTMTMYLGFSQDGRPVEVGTVEDSEAGETIIHAMPMRGTLRNRLQPGGGA